jgi:predicted XRE-type DNA-binding protein
MEMPKKGYRQTLQHIQGRLNSPEDIWKKINKKSSSECWEWDGYLIWNGYGRITIKNKGYLVHRLAYELTYGDIPEGLLVCHTCDNRKCCNPQHLFLGTQQSNYNDMVVKNRDRKANGEKQGLHKLTISQVKEIRLLYKSNSYTQKELGNLFKVGQCTISDIINYKLWRL